MLDYNLNYKLFGQNYEKIQPVIARKTDFVTKLSAQEALDFDDSTRVVSTYYKHIDYMRKDKSSLFDEIESMRKYNKIRYPNSRHQIVYVVFACR